VSATVAIAGGGPAGLAAAAAAADAGATVLLFEEQPRLGGQLRYRAQPVAARVGEHAMRPDRLLALLADEAIAAGAELRTGALATGHFPDGALLIVEGDRGWSLRPDAVIVATGSTDLPYPFAGATFPGVFSGRGLQILLNEHRVKPGRRFAVIGSGGEAEELAVDIMLAGGEVVWSGIAPAPFLAAESPDGVTALRIGQERHAVDVIAIAVGRQPAAALATMAGTALGFCAELGGMAPVVDERLQSPASGVFVAGDAAGVGSIGVAIAEGRLAGVAAAAMLGLADEDDVAAARAAGGLELARRLSLRMAPRPSFVQPYA
jgi:sarcosine oxidase subunit alpha